MKDGQTPSSFYFNAIFFISILHQFWLRLQGGINAKSAKKNANGGKFLQAVRGSPGPHSLPLERTRKNFTRYKNATLRGERCANV